MQGKMEDYPVYQYFENYVAVFAEIHQYYSEPLLNNDHPLWLTIRYWGTHGRTTAVIRRHGKHAGGDALPRQLQFCTGRAAPYGAPAAVCHCSYCHVVNGPGKWLCFLKPRMFQGILYLNIAVGKGGCA